MSPRLGKSYRDYTVCIWIFIYIYVYIDTTYPDYRGALSWFWDTSLTLGLFFLSFLYTSKNNALLKQSYRFHCFLLFCFVLYHLFLTIYFSNVLIMSFQSYLFNHLFPTISFEPLLFHHLVRIVSFQSSPFNNVFLIISFQPFLLNHCFSIISFQSFLINMFVFQQFLLNHWFYTTRLHPTTLQSLPKKGHTRGVARSYRFRSPSAECCSRGVALFWGAGWHGWNNMGVSKNNGTPKSSILIGCSIIFTIHFGVPLF